ncbi:hypothetical protein MMC18_002375 [Xylographa bjoerkii]|nr:hypothetical protein [Xylographa bjoerkii]
MEKMLQLRLQLRELAEHYSYPPFLLVKTAGLLVLGALAIFAASFKWKAPPSLLDPIPFVYNSLQFIFNNERFMIRVTTIRVPTTKQRVFSSHRKALKNARLAKFYLFSTPVFLVSGQQNIQTIFARSHKVGGEALFVQNVFPILYDMPKEDVRCFAEDKSGRGRVPAPGTDDVPLQRRYWFGYERVHSDYLNRIQHLRPMAEYFSTRMSGMLDERYAMGEWTTVSLIDFCKR